MRLATTSNAEIDTLVKAIVAAHATQPFDDSTLSTLQFDLQDKFAINDEDSFLIVADERINTPASIDSRELHANVYVKRGEQTFFGQFVGDPSGNVFSQWAVSNEAPNEQHSDAETSGTPKDS